MISRGSLGGVDVMSARLWLDRTVVTETPANVFSRFRGELDQDFLMRDKGRDMHFDKLTWQWNSVHE